MCVMHKTCLCIFSSVCLSASPRRPSLQDEQVSIPFIIQEEEKNDNHQYTLCTFGLKLLSPLIFTKHRKERGTTQDQ